MLELRTNPINSKVEMGIDTNKISSPPTDPQVSLTHMLIFNISPLSTSSVSAHMQRVILLGESKEKGSHVTLCILKPSSKNL